MNAKQKKQAAIAKRLAAMLEKAASEMWDYYSICQQLGEPVREGDDARLLIKERMEQYASLLKSRFPE